ncbi:MAG: MOSC domain-containing protein [Lachnospiraceae bacterium]
MGTIMAICISERRGTQKKRIPEARLIEDFGIEEDAHAGNWHRQVSLLSYETIEAFKAKGAQVQDGAFGENVVVQGIDLIHLPIGTRLCCNDILMEVTQIGKECHTHCEIYHTMGECIMPSNGIFARVLHGGVMKTGDEIRICT